MDLHFPRLSWEELGRRESGACLKDTQRPGSGSEVPDKQQVHPHYPSATKEDVCVIESAPHVPAGDGPAHAQFPVEDLGV